MGYSRYDFVLTILLFSFLAALLESVRENSDAKEIDFLFITLL